METCDGLASHPILGGVEILLDTCTQHRNQDNLQLYGHIYGYDVNSQKKLRANYCQSAQLFLSKSRRLYYQYTFLDYFPQINLLSKQFVQWDNTLTQIEQAMEVKQADQFLGHLSKQMQKIFKGFGKSHFRNGLIKVNKQKRSAYLSCETLTAMQDRDSLLFLLS